MPYTLSQNEKHPSNTAVKEKLIIENTRLNKEERRIQRVTEIKEARFFKRHPQDCPISLDPRTSTRNIRKEIKAVKQATNTTNSWLSLPAFFNNQTCLAEYQVTQSAYISVPELRRKTLG